MSNRGFRWWLGTWNNPTEDYKEVLKNSGAKYGRGQLEIGQQGTTHVQFTLFFVDSIVLSKAKNKLPDGIHLTGKPGAAKKDICDYVWKDETSVSGTRFEFGRVQGITASGQEKYDAAMARVKDQSILEIEAELLVKHFHTLLKLEAIFATPYESKSCRGIWIFGEPDSGKSHLAREFYGDSLFIKMQNKWWDGYRGERNVLLDDFDSPAFGHLLKIWADKWKHFGEIKGSTVAMQYRTFIITSNYLPEELWPSDDQLRVAIRRRFRFIFMADRMATGGINFGKYPAGITREKRVDKRIEILPGHFIE